MKNSIKRLLTYLLIAALVVTSLPAVAFASSVSELTGLTVSNVGSISFRRTTYEYDKIVANSVRTTRVTPRAASKDAVITVNGVTVESGRQSETIDLEEGGNTITIVVRVIDDEDEEDTTTYSVSIERLARNETVANITTSSFPDGAVGRSYSLRLTASGSGAKDWYLDTGALPEGLSFNSSTGQITGIPREGSEGNYEVMVTVYSGSNFTSDEDTFNFTIYERGTRLDDIDDDDSTPARTPTPAPRPAAPAPAATAQVSTVSQANLLSQFQSRLNSAAAGAAVSPRYRNLGTVELTTLQAIAKAAGSRTVRLTSERQDEDGNVESRVTIDPKQSTKTLSLLSSTTISSENCRNVTALMNRFYSNQVSVIRLDQKGALGQTASVYAKLDNPRLNTASLRFYSYDSALNKLEVLTTGYRVSEDGYVTFNTATGNYVIVTDSAMRQK